MQYSIILTKDIKYRGGLVSEHYNPNYTLEEINLKGENYIYFGKRAIYNECKNESKKYHNVKGNYSLNISANMI